MVSIPVVSGILLYLCVCCIAIRTWNFEIISASAKSSNENLIYASLKVDRISFSESSLSGIIDFKYDVYDTTMLEMFTFRSFSGREYDYYELPYKMPKLTFSEFIGKYYDAVLYANFGNCSNLPTFEEKFVQPLPKIKIVINNCSLTGDGFPEILPVGYYKIQLQISGPVEVNILITTKLTPKFL